MRLTSNYNKVNIFTSFVILILTGIIYYVFIHAILTDKLDRDLGVEENEIRQYTATYQKLPLPAGFLDQQVAYKEIEGEDVERTFAYTNYFNSKESEEEPGRSLVTSVKLGSKIFRVTITKSRLESEDLVRIILLITLATTLVLLASLLLINRFFFKRIWKPFYTILEQIKSFEVSKTQKIEIEPTRIDEFIELNTSVNAMAERVKQDYRELKSFTDNASHEMMTPLAVINSKLDSLLQTENFTQQQSAYIGDIYYATGKLSRLHRSLLLLSKIENNLISDRQLINMQELINGKIRQFEELFKKNNLKVNANIGSLELNMSKFLADILLNNLFSNAVRHNIDGGEIDVFLDQENLRISNTGKDINIDGMLFERFSKSVESEGMGLGLAITKQICNLYNFNIKHNYLNGRHVFSIKFNGGS
ncbi:HAMP domain-containing histidine kinase [Pedobacter changchengzhani]|uniref:histidine kinase n=1 Tax=Pedobacter changchengzhani TaxID=2529274 RepID=A0A4R5ML36_9SPHI|nr:HAMP domain-containing sensor histidine kinase [Pedobacter changchengzhani]TDG36156.1 HAMP domain-containing histidine kinase [Pedobacter changchengzhani]